jgi:hypothetical protein
VGVGQYVPDRNGHAAQAPLPIPAGGSEPAGERASLLMLEAPESPEADVHIVVKHFNDASPPDADR